MKSVESTCYMSIMHSEVQHESSCGITPYHAVAMHPKEMN
jgi:hypothetical protein